MEWNYWKRSLNDEELLREAENIEEMLYNLPDVDALSEIDSDQENDEDIAEDTEVASTVNTNSEDTPDTNCEIQANIVDRKWRKKDCTKHDTIYSIRDGANADIFAACNSPTDVFITLLEPALDNIVYQSNLYAVQNDRILNLKKSELLAFVGLNLFMGYHILPSWKHYWSTSEDLGVPYAANVMPRNRFEKILQNLHVNDNISIPRSGKDKAHKIRPLISTLNDQFYKCSNGTRELSIDESMILFKGRSSLKQYNPMKPIKRGYKLWSIADQNGYILGFELYQGKDEEMKKEYATFGLGERVVLSLSKPFWNQNRKLFFDNYFTSIPLLEKLLMENTQACGTIRATREYLPQNMEHEKKMKRGDYDYRFSSTTIGYFTWKDNKVVHFASNYHGSEETAVRRKQKDGTYEEIKCPVIVTDYNSNMGGVDLADQLRSTYCVDRKSRKWWHRIFWGLIDITFVNASIISNQLFEKMSPLEFRRSVATGLMVQSDTLNQATKKRCSTASPSTLLCRRKRRKYNYSVPDDVRKAKLGKHWPVFTPHRGRCEMCSSNAQESRPQSKCSTCNVYLCCNNKKQCFLDYHEITI